MRSISRVSTASSEVNRLQDQVVPAVNLLLASQLFQPVVITVDLSTTPLDIAHGLNRLPTGYIVVGLTSAAIITFSYKNEKTIRLTATAATTASLIFF
jgi:hypothetical protein